MSGFAPVTQLPVVLVGLIVTVPFAGVVDKAPVTAMPASGATLRTFTVAAPPNANELSPSTPLPPLPFARILDALLPTETEPSELVPSSVPCVRVIGIVPVIGVLLV